MPIIHYPGYISKEEFAKTYKITVRTINDWIRKVSSPPDYFHYHKVDDYVCVKDPTYSGVWRTDIPFQSLELVRHFAARHKISYERVYEDIIIGRISGVVLCNHIFIINTEPELLANLSAYKRKKK